MMEPNSKNQTLSKVIAQISELNALVAKQRSRQKEKWNKKKQLKRAKQWFLSQEIWIAWI